MELGTLTPADFFEQALEKFVLNQGRSATLDKLCEALKINDLGKYAELLLKTYASEPAEEITPEKPQEVADGCFSFGRKKSLPSTNLETRLDDVIKPNAAARHSDDHYKLPTHGSKGHAFVLNMIEYKGSQKRNMAVADSKNLLSTLEQLNYSKIDAHVDAAKRYAKVEVEELIQDFRDKCVTADPLPKSIIVFVGGHGEKDKLVNGFNEKIDIYREIVYQFDSQNAQALNQIPKIFIFQCCQNFPPTTDKTKVLPAMDNAIVCLATIPGKYAWKFSDRGSIFVDCLTQAIRHKAHDTDFEEILKITKDMVWEEIELLCEDQLDSGVEREEVETGKQMPSYMAIGRFRKFYFNVAKQ